ncbi:MAG: hypothetical protein WB795_16455 [Candidatus Acidiferrales bacterium]|jgi:hypothetical protein
MRSISHGILAAALLGSVGIAPALGAAAKPLGSVIQSEGGSIDNVGASVGASVFSGDAIGTTQNAAGRLRLRLGAAQMFLLADSTATLIDIPGGVAANLTYGTAGFSTSGAEPVEIRTSNGIVRSKGPDGSYGQVMIAGPHELIVTSFHGALDIDVDGQIQTVNEGQSYRVVVDDDPSAQTDDSGAGTKGMKQNAGDIRVRRRRPVVFYLIIFGFSALLGYFYYHHLNESPSAP